MRKALFLSLALLAAGDGVAFAQRGGTGGGDIDAPRERRFQIATPVQACPDLALGVIAYVAAIPNAAPLEPGEIALQWTVNNGGSAPYTAPSAQVQSLTLEYVTAAGLHQVAQTPIPQAAAEAPAPVTLAQGQSWRGYLRAQLTPEARRRTLRLHIRYVMEGRAAANDCDIDNNETTIPGPPN